MFSSHPLATYEALGGFDPCVLACLSPACVYHKPHTALSSISQSSAYSYFIPLCLAACFQKISSSLLFLLLIAFHTFFRSLFFTSLLITTTAITLSPVGIARTVTSQIPPRPPATHIHKAQRVQSANVSVKGLLPIYIKCLLFFPPPFPDFRLHPSFLLSTSTHPSINLSIHRVRYCSMYSHPSRPVPFTPPESCRE